MIVIIGVLSLPVIAAIIYITKVALTVKASDHRVINHPVD